MAGITLAQAEAKLTEWMNADTAVATSQEYTTASGRRLTRADAKEIRDNIEFWDAKVKSLTRGGISVRGATIA